MTSSTLTATVVISTKNRRDSLVRSIESALSQTVTPEVVVIDDGSTDGTSEMVRRDFPSVRLERASRSHGYIAQRNRGATLARGSIIFSIDDDAHYVSARTIEQTLEEFDHSRVGAVAMPYINVNDGPQVLQRAPTGGVIFVTDAFVGTAYAIRRDLFLALGGFRADYFHQGEERDLCIRMLARGYVVRLGGADPLHHVESPVRSLHRMAVYGRRNDVLFAWYNVPGVALPIHLFGTSLLGLRHGVRSGQVGRTVLGLARGIGAGVRRTSARHPVPWSVYKLSRQLRRARCTPLTAIEMELPSAAGSHG